MKALMHEMVEAVRAVAAAFVMMIMAAFCIALTMLAINYILPFNGSH